MNILRKISFIALISFTISCNRQKKLIDTWISAPFDTVFTSWDISGDKIISNMFSPDKMIAKYKIQGNKLVIDSGVVTLNEFYLAKNESLQFRLSQDNLRIKLSTYDSLLQFEFKRKHDLLVYDRLLPNQLLNIDLPYLGFVNKVDVTHSDWVFLGHPKNKLLNKFQNRSYIQLNDTLTNPGDMILREFVSFDYHIPTVIFCDKAIKMNELDSIRSNLYNHKILFAGLNENLEFGYFETDPFYYCNCIAISNIPPPRPIQERCKHKLFFDKKINKNLFRIDTIGNYYFQNTLINISDVPKIVDLISNGNDSDTLIFIQYDDLTKFENYITLYTNLESSISSLDKRITNIDINEKDLNYIEKARW